MILIINWKMKNTLKVILWIVAVLAALILIMVVVLWIASPGKLPLLEDAEGKVIPGSISERREIILGDLKQGFFIRSENPDNPVILYLHGGPGSPELPMIMAEEEQERLEKYFTVCYWDQRGTGMSYRSDLGADDLTIQHYVDDARDLTKYLMERFEKDKIYLMGSSWGSYLGIKVIEQYPELYYTYMGIGQVTHQHLSEQLAYEYMLDHANEVNDHKALKELGQYDPLSEGFPQLDYLMGTRTTLMNKYGIGIMREDFSMFSLVMDVMMFRGYKMRDKVGYVRGSLLALENVFYFMIDDNLFESSTHFNVPVYVLHGLYDYQVSYALATEYVNMIEAPAKGLYTFEKSAHSPNMEEPARFIRVVRDIVGLHNGSNYPLD